MPEMQALPQDFDRMEYLRLNPDVARAGINPVEHYLFYGLIEGRRYKEGVRLTRADFLTVLAKFETILELGPFDRPIAPGAAPQAMIEFSDWLPQEQLIARARQTPNRSPATVPPIHYVVADGRYAERIPKKFDCVVSCHMIEHAPDLILHLQQVRQILRPGGSYVVLVPDKRCCFDHFLPESSVSEALTAYLEQRRKPTLRAVIEHRAFTVQAIATDPNPFKTPTRWVFEAAQLAAREFNTNDYVDVHCWQFTPYSLESMMNSLIAMGLLDEPSLLRVHGLRNEIGMEIGW